ncbi:hypothetical protein GQR58_026826 [Nymphon striatum]|nr:hypothetical protein GQR58_026826 [Nymphon striatum]
MSEQMRVMTRVTSQHISVQMSIGQTLRLLKHLKYVNNKNYDQQIINHHYNRCIFTVRFYGPLNPQFGYLIGEEENGENRREGGCLDYLFKTHIVVFFTSSSITCPQFNFD